MTAALAAVPARLNTQIKAPEAQLAAQLAAHADGHICTSLPRSGTARAAGRAPRPATAGPASPNPRR